MGSALLSWLLWREPEPEEEEEEDEITTTPLPEAVLPLVPLKRYVGRAVPNNVLDEAIDVVMRIAQTSVEMDEETPYVICVRLPSRNKRAAHHAKRWPYVGDPAVIARNIRALMKEDGVKAIRSPSELCARYPGHFWNIAYYHGMNVDELFEFIRNELC